MKKIIPIMLIMVVLISTIITTGTIINNYGSGGNLWYKNGNTIVLNTTSDNVNIGENATTPYKLNVKGDTYITGNLTGNSLVALGEGALSSGAGSIAIGRYSTANGVESITFGSNSWAENKGSLSMGFGSNTFGDYSLAINGGYTEGLRSIAIGQSETYGNYSLSVGSGNIVTGIQSQCFGLNNGLAGNYGFVAGNGNYLDTVAEYSGIIGVFNEVWGLGSYIIGTNSYTLGGNSYSMGNSNFVDTTGSNSMCLGDSNYVTSPNSYAFGGGNQITGNDSLALGSGITINGKNSIGINSNFLDTLVINRDSLFGVGCDTDFSKNVNVTGELSGTREIYSVSDESGNFVSLPCYMVQSNFGVMGTLNKTRHGILPIRNGSITGISINCDLSSFSTKGNLSFDINSSGVFKFNVKIPITANTHYNKVVTFKRGLYSFNTNNVITIYESKKNGLSGTYNYITVNLELTSDT